MNTIESLFSPYLAGDATPAERARLEAWLAESPENARAFAEAQALWSRSKSRSIQSAEAFLGRLEMVIRQDHTASPRIAVPPAPRRPLLRAPRSSVGWIGAAVVAIAVLGGTVTGWLGWSGARADMGTNQAEYVIAAARGERTQADLPDGSSILLGPGSTARYAKGFGASHRTITVEGQALFTVTHHRGAPFVVLTRDVQTRVLGTTFSVRYYADDPGAQVVVAAGKVAVTGPDNDMHTLASGEAIDVDPRGNMEKYRASDMAASLAWSHGRLDYAGAPLSQVVADVSRLYNVDIVLESRTLGTQRFSGIIDQQSAINAIAMIAATAALEVDRREHTFILRGSETQ